MTVWSKASPENASQSARVKPGTGLPRMSRSSARSEPPWVWALMVSSRLAQYRGPCVQDASLPDGFNGRPYGLAVVWPIQFES